MMFTKVVWATDGAPTADQALPIAKMLGAKGGKEMLVVHREELTLPVLHLPQLVGLARGLGPDEFGISHHSARATWGNDRSQAAVTAAP